MQSDTLVEQVDQAGAVETVKAADPVEAPAAPVSATPVADAATPAPEAAPEAPAPAKKTRAKSTAKKTRTVELTLTVTGTADGEWQADLVHGTKRLVSALPIAAAAVSKAAKELHEDIFDGIEAVIDAAREQHRTRMEELEAELARVKQALAELED